MNKKVFLTLGLFLLTSVSQAKVFRNAYISFEMPETWKCNLEQTEWVCRSEQSKEAKEAIIILTAKEVGPTDTFALYEQHLNGPIVSPLKTGGTTTSTVSYKAKTNSINDQAWVDGLHIASEVPNYYTRYLATIKDRIAILVTLSAHKMYYTKYSQDFFKTVQSLRVIASKNLLSRPDVGPIRPGSETLGQGIGSAMPGDLITGDEGSGKSEGGDKSMFLGLALLLAAAGGYIIYKKKKK